MIYKGEYLKEISFPLGGIGTGSVGLSGNGKLIDWEIFNRPAKGSTNGYSHFGIKAKNKNGIVTKLLNSDHEKELSGRYGACFGHGADSTLFCGFPHFKNVAFKGEFPMAELTFSDDDFPGNVKLLAFNPLIPSDAKNSSIPAAFFEIEVSNKAMLETEYTVELSIANPNKKGINTPLKKDNIQMIAMTSDELEKTDIEYKDLCIATDCEDSFFQSYWYRGNFWDCTVTFWNEFDSENDFKDRVYDTAVGKDMCTLCGKITLNPGETKKVRFVLSWNVPNNYNYWDEYKDEAGNHKTWKNYYATVFEDSKASALYSLKNWDMLYERTLKFKDALFSSTLDEAVLDAASASLSVLKSSTVLRLENGEFYGWEGVGETAGTCEGTCQHVWNYAYALCYLFPELERSIRDLEFEYMTKDSGLMEFRLRLPLGRREGDDVPCVDGQMGAVIKTYREWKISGDNEWLKSHWDDVKKVLEFAWSDKNKYLWDNDKDGVLEGMQHHTLDTELFGPSSWLESMYLAALLSASEMAKALGDTEKEKEYLELFEKGKEWTKNNLFNGKHFIHKIDLKDKSVLERFGRAEKKSELEMFGTVENFWNEETEEIKYQIANGSIIDQMLGVWHSNLIGIGEIFDPEQVKTALSSMMKLNFKENLRNHINSFRVFALNDEAGTVICGYESNRDKPRNPVPYGSEIMTGFEYSFAGLLIQNKMTDEGLKVVKAVRDRYDGKKRNPWNEIECGSNYARSMASFALISAYSGFVADLPNKTLRFNPVINKTPFIAFFAVDGGWGVFNVFEDKVILEISEGQILLSSLELPFVKNPVKVTVDGKTVDFVNKNGKIIFDETTVKNKVEIIL